MVDSDLIDHFDLAFYETQNTFEDDFLIDCLMNENDFSIDDIDVDLFTPPPPLEEIDIDRLTPDLTDLSDDFIRSLPDNNDLECFGEDNNDFGHLISNQDFQTSDNQVVETQLDALFFDTPLFEIPEDVQEERNRSMQCLWQGCYVTCHNQTSLVQHIEKIHVEVKKGDQFTCFWYNCPRKVKPFNARYKLLIHMRVHSGEKPNKCQFEGCNKAFSRLENLKIHQRSHTGERPYLCQFPTCTKSFSNSSDRAKHQRTHFDTKPYACQVLGCTKKYTDPSSLRKHVKNHTADEQMLIKKKNEDDVYYAKQARKYFDPQKQKAIKTNVNLKIHYEHDYYNDERRNVKQDLKNKISRRLNRY